MNLNVEQVQDLIGKPYALGARGPDALDCWGLCMEVYARVGVRLPDYAAPTRAQVRAMVDGQDHVDWINEPEPWCFVYSNRLGHIGLYVHGRVMHSARNIGVVVQDLRQFKMIYPDISFARWREC